MQVRSTADKQYTTLGLVKRYNGACQCRYGGYLALLRAETDEKNGLTVPHFTYTGPYGPDVIHAGYNDLQITIEGVIPQPKRMPTFGYIFLRIVPMDPRTDSFDMAFLLPDCTAGLWQAARTPSATLALSPSGRRGEPILMDLPGPQLREVLSRLEAIGKHHGTKFV